MFYAFWNNFYRSMRVAWSGGASLRVGVCCTNLARDAKARVDKDSSTQFTEGVSVQTRQTLAFPPKEGCNKRVSLDSRKGMWCGEELL